MKKFSLPMAPHPVRSWLIVLVLSFCAVLGRAQQADGVIYTDAPRPKCDSFSMQNRFSLTKLEKTCYYRDQLFAPSAVFGAGMFAGVAQATNSPPQWPQGARGYAWRYGTRYVQGMAKTTGGYLVGLLFHEDPRPVRPDCTQRAGTRDTFMEAPAPRTFWQRLRGAVTVNFYARNDHCNLRPAFSVSAAALSSGFVGMVWTPDPSNTVTKAFVRSGTALGGSIGNSVFTEFRGDIISGLVRMFGRKPATTGEPK